MTENQPEPGDSVQVSIFGSVETKLVNVSEFGRSGVTMIGRSTDYGSPFKLEKDGGSYTRQESVEAFRNYWYSEECDDLRERAKDELRGETLGCYCLGKADRYDGSEAITETDGEPKVCHGEVILRFLNGEEQ